MAGMGFVQPELVFIGMIGGFLIYGLTNILSTLWKSSAKKPKKMGKKI
jgi:hypothetical protein